MPLRGRELHEDGTAEPIAVDDDTGSADSGAHCIVITTGDGMADETASGGADETTA